jgi:hypothetical protein
MDKSKSQRLFDALIAANIPYVHPTLVKQDGGNEYTVEVPFGSAVVSGKDILTVLGLALATPAAVTVSSKGIVLN